MIISIVTYLFSLLLLLTAPATRPPSDSCTLALRNTYHLTPVSAPHAPQYIENSYFRLFRAVTLWLLMITGFWQLIHSDMMLWTKEIYQVFIKKSFRHSISYTDRDLVAPLRYWSESDWREFLIAIFLFAVGGVLINLAYRHHFRRPKTFWGKLLGKWYKATGQPWTWNPAAAKALRNARREKEKKKNLNTRKL